MSKVHKKIKYKGSTYIFSDQHRSASNRHKSIWTIDESKEFISFTLMYDQNWIFEKYKGWSFHRVDSNKEFLGLSPKREQVKIAKFVDSCENGEWHGFPIDYRYSVYDKPTTEILKEWVAKGEINKAQMRKISQGKDCNL